MNKMNELRGAYGQYYDKHIFRPLVWTRRVREFGEFGVVLLIKDDLIDRISLHHQDNNGRNPEVQHFISYEDLEAEIKRISQDTGIRIDQNEMSKIKRFWDVYEESPELTIAKTGKRW